MSFNLLNELSNVMKDEKKFGQEGNGVHMSSTGFDCFDYLNGSLTITPDGESYYHKGLDDGKIVTIIGKSGSGKTTFAIQTAYNLIKKYEQGSIFILDFEQSSDRRRIRSLTGMSEEECDRKVLIKKVGISTETVLDTIVAIKKLKLEHKKDLMIKTGELNPDGTEVEIMTPTVVIVDSIPMMMPREALLDEEMSGQMLATQAAKMNSQLFKRIVQPMVEANIICFFINHINQKVSTGPMPTQAQVNYLGQEESLPGGNAPIYLSNTLVKITTSSKLEEDKLFKIKGYFAKVSLVKSRTAPAGSSITMVFDQVNGFDNLLSNLQFLKDNGNIAGAGIGMYLQSYPSVKFSFANFREKYNTIPEFKQEFDKAVEENLKELIRNPRRLDDDYAENKDIVLNEEDENDG